MGKGIKVTVRGTRELQRAIKKITKHSRDELENALNAGGRVILSAAQSRAPVRTGYLREHLSMKTAFDDDKGVLIVVGGTIPDKKHSANLAWWQEFGTSKQPARPFLRPAFDESKNTAQNAIVSYIKRVMKL